MASSAVADDVVITDEARKHFQTGVDLLDDPDGARNEEAYRAFKAAYAASPSPKILGNIGLCAMRLERDSEAIDAYTRYLAEVADIPEEDKTQIEKDLATLKAGVVSLELTIEPAGAMVVDRRVPVRGNPVINRYGPVQGALNIGIRAGHHELEVTLDGYETATWEFDARMGGTVQHSIVLQIPTGPPPETETTRPVPLSVYIGLAATGAFALVGVITGSVALGKKGDYEEKNDGTNPGEAEKIRDSGVGLNIATDIMFGAAIVSAGVTAILFFTRPEVEVGADDGADRARLTFTPAVGPGGAAFQLSGTF